MCDAQTNFNLSRDCLHPNFASLSKGRRRRETQFTNTTSSLIIHCLTRLAGHAERQKMPKNTKSSASSATRKKKSQKAAKKGGGGPDGAVNGTAPPQTPAQRGQKKVKGKGKEPKKKVFIPPTKPKQDVIDPLDSLGLANMLPSDLVVLLRKAGKKDVVTRSRALEGLIDWLQSKDEEEEVKENALILAIPCWVSVTKFGRRN